jgi:hypothetical protein
LASALSDPPARRRKAVAPVSLVRTLARGERCAAAAAAAEEEGGEEEGEGGGFFCGCLLRAFGSEQRATCHGRA